MPGEFSEKKGGCVFSSKHLFLFLHDHTGKIEEGQVFFLKKGTPSPFPEEILGPCGNRPPLFRKTGKKDLPMPSSKTQPAWSQSRPKTRGLHRPQRGQHLRKGSPGTAGSAPGKPVLPFSPPFLQLGRSPQKPPCPPLQNENLPGFCMYPW